MARAKPLMVPSRAPAVVIGREVTGLGFVPRGMTAEEAASRALIVRRKVEGIWLYARHETTIDTASAEVLEAARGLCGDWLVGAMRMLAGKIAKDSGLITMEAVRPLLRAHVRVGNLSALPALTAEYEPHIALFDPADSGEMQHLLSAAQAILSADGYVGVADLPDPEKARNSRAWRYVVIQHLEWLGLGSAAEGQLTSWASL